MSVIFDGTEKTYNRISWSGFAGLEDGYCWSSERFGRIEIKLHSADRRSKTELAISVAPFLHAPTIMQQSIAIYVNGIRAIAGTYAEDSEIKCPLPTFLPEQPVLVIDFDFPDAVVPRKLGIDDDRLLGFRLSRIALT